MRKGSLYLSPDLVVPTLLITAPTYKHYAPCSLCDLAADLGAYALAFSLSKDSKDVINLLLVGWGRCVKNHHLKFLRFACLY